MNSHAHSVGTLQERARIKLIETYDKAGRIWPQAKFVFPRLVFKNMGRRAGKASVCHTLWISPFYLEKHPEHIINDTVVHEAAHLIAWDLYGLRGWNHGPLWQHVMKTLGIIAPQRCHSMEADAEIVPGGRRIKKFEYHCTCGKVHEVGAAKHKRIQAGRVYICTTSNARLMAYNLKF